MATSITLKLTKKTGEEQEFADAVSSEIYKCDLKKLHTCVRDIQSRINEALTVLVDEERQNNSTSQLPVSDNEGNPSAIRTIPFKNG